MPYAPDAGEVFSPCPCGGRLPAECGLSFCKPKLSRLEFVARRAGLEPDELRDYLAAHVNIATEGAT